MKNTYQETIIELTTLASSLGEELEAALLEKQASDSELAKLRAEVEALKKEATTAAHEKVLLEKVASHGVISPELIPILGQFEKIGFIKEGSAMEAYNSLKSRPDLIVPLLQNIADSFANPLFSEGDLEKSASAKILPTTEDGDTYVDKDGWSRIIEEGA